MNIWICDDDSITAEELRKRITEYREISPVVRLFQSGKELIDSINAGKSDADVILMDIEMGEENGVEISSEITELLSDIKIIFVTGYRDEYVEKLFLQVKPFGILSKPVDNDVLRELLLQAESIDQDNKILAIKYKNIVSNIRINDIIYIESYKRVAYIHTINGEEQCYLTLDDLEEKLPDTFVRCHKSYLVNMKCIARFTANKFILKDGTEITVSRTKLSEARKQYFDYIGMRM